MLVSYWLEKLQILHIDYITFRKIWTDKNLLNELGDVFDFGVRISGVDLSQVVVAEKKGDVVVLVVTCEHQPLSIFPNQKGA